jgi:hypothetical protein
MTEELPTKIKRVFKRLRIGELSLVDEACVPGSDVVVIKARKGGLSETHESYDNRDRSEGQWHPGGAQVSEAELIEKGLKPYADLVEQLEASSISVSDFLAQGDAMVASLMTEAETGGSPVAKSAANTVASMVMESVVDLKELNTAYAALEARVEVLNGETNVAKGRAAAAEAALAEANAALAAKDEQIAKSKPAPTQAEQDEVVLKGLPEHLRAEFVQNRADREARDNEAEVAKARKMGLADPEAVGKALRTLRAADADALAIVEKAMYSAADTNKAAKGLMKSYGVAVAEGTDGEDDPEAALQAKADEVRKARPELSAAQAYDLALDANPALYGQIVAKRRAGAAMAGQ